MTESIPRRLRALERAFSEAESYEEWRQIAEEHDQLTGAREWREQEDSPCYDSAQLRASLERIRRLRQQEDAQRLASVLSEELYQHLHEISSPELYQRALSGTKRLVEDYLDEAEGCLRWLAGARFPQLTPGDVLRRFKRARDAYGRSALLLSGGATWGFHHLGVIKALFEHDLLPGILSGSSTGAMIAAGVGARDDEQLREMFEHPELLRWDGLMGLPWRERLDQKAWLSADQLREVLRHNVGELTFAEAYARSGRALSISVSPTRVRQKPRLLTHTTSPEVLVASAALASSALPGLFPPVGLEAKDSRGRIRPYMERERWVDGSIHGDLPKLRLSRLHNVNHFIVSQTNPHILPFARPRERSGLSSAAAGLVSTTLRAQAGYSLGLAAKAVRPLSGRLRLAVEQAQALAVQEYEGDITIHPRMRLDLVPKIVTNPSLDDLSIFILEGERAVWPRLEQIRNQTRLDRAFQDGVRQLEQQARASAGAATRDASD